MLSQENCKNTGKLTRNTHTHKLTYAHIFLYIIEIKMTIDLFVSRILRRMKFEWENIWIFSFHIITMDVIYKSIFTFSHTKFFNRQKKLEKIMTMTTSGRQWQRYKDKWRESSLNWGSTPTQRWEFWTRSNDNTLKKELKHHKCSWPTENEAKRTYLNTLMNVIINKSNWN